MEYKYFVIDMVGNFIEATTSKKEAISVCDKMDTEGTVIDRRDNIIYENKFQRDYNNR